ncbi:MAG: hypothetical protein ACRD3O_02980 [Terriglobia bacterium]
MANQDQYALVQPASSRRRLQRAIKRAGIGLLFSLVLVVPALRRARRRFWIWSAIRLAAVLAGGWLITRFLYASAGAGILTLGILLAAFGLLLRARPLEKSVEMLARELSALVVMNGGSLIPANGKPVARVSIFASSDCLLVLSRLRQQLLQIPFARICELSAHADASATTRPQGGKWDLDITWRSENLITTRFCYDGAFAEHLARVAEKTVRSLWKKELPVLR